MLGCIWAIIFVFVRYRPCFAIKYFKIGSCLLWPSVIFKSCHIQLLFHNLSTFLFYWCASSLLYQYYKIKFITILWREFPILLDAGKWCAVSEAWSVMNFSLDLMLWFEGMQRNILQFVPAAKKYWPHLWDLSISIMAHLIFSLITFKAIQYYEMTSHTTFSDIRNRKCAQATMNFTADFKGQLGYLLNGIRGLTALLYILSPPPLLRLFWLSDCPVWFPFSLSGCSHEEQSYLQWRFAIIGHRC